MSPSIEEREKLYNQWTGLVTHLMRTRFSRVHKNDCEDLKQVGYEALWKATAGYDPAKSNGAKFSSYAFKCCWSKMVTYVKSLYRRRYKEWTNQDLKELGAAKTRGVRVGRCGERMVEVYDWTDHAGADMDNREVVQLLDSHLLGTRDYTIVKARANGDKLKDIAKRYGICSERARQLEARGLEEAAEVLRENGVAA